MAVSVAVTTAIPAVTRCGRNAAVASSRRVMPIARSAGASVPTVAADLARAWPTNATPASAMIAASNLSIAPSTSVVAVTRRPVTWKSRTGTPGATSLLASTRKASMSVAG